jgi:type I restriction enzyme S subunit
MSMTEKKKHIVPRLRFPEFRDAGPWEVKRLGEVLEEHGLKSSGNEEVYSVSVHKGLINQIEHLGRSFAANTTEHYNRVLPGDIVYTKSPTGDFPYGIIKQNKSGKTVIVSPLYGVFRPKNYAIGTLLDAYFESPFRAKAFLAPLVQKGAKNTINIPNFRFLDGALPLPQDEKEQQKIADCLSSLDEVIELQAKKLEALKAHKRGLMQQLFPREGETTPRLRFPEFRDAGPWEVKRLGEIATISMGSSPPSSTYNTEGHGLPLLQGMADVEDKVSRPRVFTTLVTKACKPGDILLSVRAPVGAVAKAIHNACIGRGWAAIRGKNGTIQQFLYQYLLSLEGAWARISQGGTFDSVTREDVASFPVALGDLFEQQKIADCLSSLDEVIELETKKLEALKAHKKGLLQQLFPQEVTP